MSERPKPLKIWYTMIQSGLDPDFVTLATELSLQYEGMYELMCMWLEDENPRERELTLETIRETVKDCTREN